MRPSRRVSSLCTDCVRAGDERGDVARDAAGSARTSQVAGAAVGAGVAPPAGGRRVADDLPVRGRGHRERERGLEVGLLEHREHAAGVRHLELRVEVDLAVDRVDEAVQALAGVRVRGVGDHDQLVLGREVRELDAHAVADLGRIEFAAVEGDGCTARVMASMKVEAPGVAVKRTVVVEPKTFSPRGQVEADLVAVDVDEGGALLGFDAGEVLSGQRGLQKKMDTAGRPQPPAIL